MATRTNVIPLHAPPRRGPAVPADASDDPGAAALEGGPSWSDVGLLVAILGVSLFPLAGLATGLARFGPGELGLATACAVFSGRELVAQLRDLARRP